MRKLILIATAAAGAAASAEMPVLDFAKTVPLRPALHGSGLGGCLIGAGARRIDELKPLNFHGTRTHDWALNNPGQRLLDTHFIFPLLHLDAKDERNYFFGPTDEILDQTVNRLGLHVMYRLGTSIESVNSRRDWKDESAPKPGYYNCVEPADWEKYATVLEHIIAHYVEGWNRGYRWQDKIRYWELWNEPNDRPGGSWLNADGDFDHDRNLARFIKFYAYTLKRLKTRFPQLKFGGPAACGWKRMQFLKDLLAECKAVGYTPDFISWHMYTPSPHFMLNAPEQFKRLCEESGFGKMELVINEWHYLPYDGVWGDFGRGPEAYARTINPVDGLGSIEDAIYTLQVEEGVQHTILDQSCWYGCNPAYGAIWGIRKSDGSLNKPYYAQLYMGTIVGDCDRCAARAKGLPFESPWQAYGYVSKDGRRKYVSVSRFKGLSSFALEIKGLDGLRCTSIRMLDRDRDFVEVVDQQRLASGKAEESLTPFSPAVSAPIFRRKGDVFTFERFETGSVAWLFTFE